VLQGWGQDVKKKTRGTGKYPLAPTPSLGLYPKTDASVDLGWTSFNAGRRPRNFYHPLSMEQQTVGNHAVLQMRRASSRQWTAHMGHASNGNLLRRKCACGGSEEECAACKEKREARLQRTASQPGFQRGAPPVVYDVLRSPGKPLDQATKTFFESRFHRTFSEVRVRADAPAAEAARRVGALAFTVGSDIVFDSGRYAPNTAAGRSLLAHELVHVLQQREAPAGRLELSNPEGPAEKEAATYSNAILNHQPVVAFMPPPVNGQAVSVSRQNVEGQSSQGGGGSQSGPQCTPAPGVPPSGHCSAYLGNAWWLPLAYVNNATCACQSTPNVPTANCVRKFLQDRLTATPLWVKSAAAAAKALEANPSTLPKYEAFVQGILTPRIYTDHVDAYRSCCCPFGPAPYYDWIGVTTVPIRPCSLVGWFIDHFGSCTGTPGSW
jgi:uncharacterized protein DUF4157